MGAPPPVRSSLDAYGDALVAAAERHPTLRAIEARAGEDRSPGAGAERLGPRFVLLPLHPTDVAAAAVRPAPEPGPVFLAAPAAFLFGEAFPEVVRSIVRPRADVKLIALPPGPGAAVEPSWSDLATMRALPTTVVLAPADPATVRDATLALAERRGPAYVRLPGPPSTALPERPFAIGRARELRPGDDLTVVGFGPPLTAALALADELGQVGVATRVLDVASLKPLDEAAILRAARDTGALLVVEPAPLATGIGSVIAAMAAENHPVPVRRLGWPDLAPDDAAVEPPFSAERLRDEAWELLRQRGKVS